MTLLDNTQIIFNLIIKLSKIKNSDGIIVIKVQNGFGPEIQLAVPFLLNQINARYGFKAITKVKIIQTDIGYNQIIEQDFSKNDIIGKNISLTVLPDGEIKLAMQKFEISRNKRKGLRDKLYI